MVLFVCLAPSPLWNLGILSDTRSPILYQVIYFVQWECTPWLQSSLISTYSYVLPGMTKDANTTSRLRHQTATATGTSHRWLGREAGNSELEYHTAKLIICNVCTMSLVIDLVVTWGISLCMKIMSGKEFSIPLSANQFQMSFQIKKLCWKTDRKKNVSCINLSAKLLVMTNDTECFSRIYKVDVLP